MVRKPLVNGVIRQKPIAHGRVFEGPAFRLLLPYITPIDLPRGYVFGILSIGWGGEKIFLHFLGKRPPDKHIKTGCRMLKGPLLPQCGPLKGLKNRDILMQNPEMRVMVKMHAVKRGFMVQN